MPSSRPAPGSRQRYARRMKPRVVILGAGFGGLELATLLSEALGDYVDVTLIDQNDSFVFGYAKLDVMFGRTTGDAIRIAYGDIEKPGVRFLKRRSQRSTPNAARDHRRRESTTLTSWSWRSAPTTTWMRLRARRRRATSSTPLPAPSGWASCFRASRGAERSSASARRLSNARRRRARRLCCCTIICRSAASAISARSPSSFPSQRRSRRHRTPHARWSTPSSSGASSSSPPIG